MQLLFIDASVNLIPITIVLYVLYIHTYIFYLKNQTKKKIIPLAKSVFV